MGDNERNIMVEVKEYLEPYFTNIMDKLKEIKSDIDKLYDIKNTLAEKVVRIETQIKIIWAINGAIGLTVVGWIITKILGLIK